MIVYLEDQRDEFCIYIRSRFIDARYEYYNLIRLTKNIDKIEEQFNDVTMGYIYISKEDLKRYL